MKPHTPAPGEPGEPSDETLRAWLSELADGEAGSAGQASEAGHDKAQAACQAWRESADMRRAWHSYHLIGDVLRSEELGRAADHDANFLARLREKLAEEPVVMAPMPERAAQPAVIDRAAAGTVVRDSVNLSRRRRAWLAPAAAAAGFVVVAGVLVVSRLSAPGAELNGAVQARSGANNNLTLATAPAVPSASSAGVAMIRDARLDAYLQAHQSVRGGSAAAVPGAGLRSVEVVVPAGNGR
jgi:sigma-E factor negative regulatory protein RseA